ncbi:MAG: LytTR family transcriptional regulator [Bacteroidaceae bacterium]|nr:LytTR family transcriptional regulator [Bacteroidaceae bacterium]
MADYSSILFQKLPKYLLTKQNQLMMVLFVSLFAVVFINIFKPFGSEDWMTKGKFTSTQYLAWSTILVCMGMSIVAISRVIMYHYSKKPTHKITILKYICWIIIELLLLSAAFTILALITSYGGATRDPLEIYKNAMENTVFILFIPYLIGIMYLSYQDKSAKLRTIMEENIGNKSTSFIAFRDERGVLRLTVAKENLLYIESADNYISIWYLKNNQLKKQLLRMTLKELSVQLGETNVVRCHRSFMVNLDQVKVLRREKENMFIELGYQGVQEIPISKTYGEEVLRRIIPIE